MKGVEDCIVGYSGGKQRNPTYQSIYDSTESVLIEYDPNQITYKDILGHWKKRTRGYPGMKRQYRSAIFYITEEQESIARNIIKQMKIDNGGRDVYVDVEPVTPFYRAEEYHQHFMAKKIKGGSGYGVACAI